MNISKRAFISHIYFQQVHIKVIWGYLALLLSTFSYADPSQGFDVKAHLSHSVSSQSTLYNPEAVIPSQCYTKTGGEYNPCYACHQFSSPGHVNRMDDGELQGSYDFSDIGVTNHWVNLFEDRRPRIAKTTDKQIQDYINQDNYTSLASNLKKRNWQGWIPDLENLELGSEAFDEMGFAKDGSDWVAYNYSPLPSTFWPTNGSTDDVMIRLPQSFRLDEKGNYNRDIYLLNLSIVEAAIKNFRVISIPNMDEKKLGLDLDGDGHLTTATQLKRPKFYLGKASDIKVQTNLYPKSTEFLHTVRYVGVDEETGEIFNPKRMKEVRYMVKTKAIRKSTLGNFYAEEQQDKFEGNLPRYPTLGDKGIDNKFGWLLSGFIEDAEGELRPQVYEEQLFCMGCHTTIGSIVDSTFSFSRKPDGVAGWGYIDLKDMSDVPTYGENEGAVKAYLRRVGGGNEFRINEEMQTRFFNTDGSLNEEALKSTMTLYDIIAPSVERAMKLNKAYKTIVEDQDFIFGRDANIAPADNVYKEINTEIPPLEPEFRHSSDIRLNWSEKQQTIR